MLWYLQNTEDGSCIACEVLTCSDENVQYINNFLTLFIAHCFCCDKCPNCRQDCKLFSYVFDIKFGLYFGLMVCLSHSPSLASGVLKMGFVSLVQICWEQHLECLLWAPYCPSLIPVFNCFCVCTREVSSFQGENITYLYEVGTWSSVLIREVSSFQGCPLRGVPLY